jgi:hypothetical protein
MHLGISLLAINTSLTAASPHGELPKKRRTWTALYLTEILNEAHDDLTKIAKDITWD